MMGAAPLAAGKSGPLALWLLVLVFALPPLAGWFFYLNPQWLPSGRSNHGVLIQPPRPLNQLALAQPDGAVFNWDNYLNYWKLVVVGRGVCATDCEQQLAQTHQVLRAIGASRNMVKQLVILLPAAAGSVARTNDSSATGVPIALASGESSKQAEKLFGLDRVDPEQAVFIVAPDNALMMRHDLPATTPEQMMQDLETLLKASQNWVKGN